MHEQVDAEQQAKLAAEQQAGAGDDVTPAAGEENKAEGAASDGGADGESKES